MCSIVNSPVDVLVRAEEREWKQTATEGNGGTRKDRKRDKERSTKRRVHERRR